MPSSVDPAIFVHANVGDRKVAARAMEALGVSKAAAVGHLVMFWGKAAQAAPDGILLDFNDEQIEEWASWKGKRGRFASFIRRQHLDEDGRPREWEDYAGKLAVQRQKERDKKRAQRDAKEEVVPGTDGGQGGGHNQGRPGDKGGTVPEVPSQERGEGRGKRVQELKNAPPAGEVAASPISAVVPPADMAWWPDGGTREAVAAVYVEIAEPKQPGWRQTLTGFLRGLDYPGGKEADARDVAAGLLAARSLKSSITDVTPGLVAGCAINAERRRLNPGATARPDQGNVGHTAREIARLKAKIAAENGHAH